MTTLQEALIAAALDASSRGLISGTTNWAAFVAESLRAALAQHGKQAKPVAYITDTHQGPMVWTPEMYDEACTYCDDGEFPVPLYTVTPRPTSGDYALGYAEGFNDACKPAPQTQQPVAWYEYNQDLDAWFLAYGHNPKAKTRPLVFGDTATPAPVEQRCTYCDGTGDVHGIDGEWRGTCPCAAAPAPQAQPATSDEWLANCPQEVRDFANKLKAAPQPAQTTPITVQSAQQVAQPPKTCATCTHYKQGKNPSTGVYDSDCYGCSEYYANKWEMK